MTDHDAMADHDIDERLRRYYGPQQLSTGRLAKLREMVQSTNDTVDESRNKMLPSRHRNRGKIPSVAAGLAVLVLIGLVVWSTQRGDGEPTAASVAEEIATNHNRDMPVEVETGDFDRLADGLDKLDFRPVPSRRLDERGLLLVGGRYCKIQGQIAAQIKLRDADGRTWTLYECRDTELLRNVRACRVETLGLEIELWREAGVLLGLAGPPD